MQHISRETRIPIPAVPQPHTKALTDHPAYVAVGVRRIPVPADRIPWSVPFPEYDACHQERFDHPAVLQEFAVRGSAGWAADPAVRASVREVTSYCTPLPHNGAGEPLNPRGRTGIKDGRGLLGNWGPNFAADPIVFGVDPQRNLLELCLVTRKDTGELALPGGMVEYGEVVSQTLRRELGEESGLTLSMDDATVVYRGYVDDPRNTDKAWIETVVAYNVLSATDRESAVLRAGDDAREAQWVAVNSELLDRLYASHGTFVRAALAHLLRSAAQLPGQVRVQVTGALRSGPIHS